MVDPNVLQVDPHLDRFTAQLQQQMSASQTQVQTEQPSASLIAAAKRAADELIVPGPLDSEMPPPGSADKINAAVAAGNAAMARCCSFFENRFVSGALHMCPWAWSLCLLSASYHSVLEDTFQAAQGCLSCTGALGRGNG